jgi:hypothetical protein
MEVHHHPHVAKKNFKEYFLEFLMIFLAVTMGFIAENLREHFTERSNAREYAHLLVNDLNSDVKELNRTHYVLERIINAGDSLSSLIASPNLDQIPSGKLYYYEYWSSWQWRVTPQDATFKQLQNSGALRYIGNASLIKKILDYEESLKIIALLENNASDEKNENWKLVQKVFDLRYFNTLDTIKAAARDSASHIYSMNWDALDKFKNTNYPLITRDKNTMLELGNWALSSSRSYKTLIRTVDFAKQKAIEAMVAIQKQYRIEEH